MPSRARERAAELDLTIDFRVMDVLNPDREFVQSRYDVILDQGCFHTLVVDEDRRQYLSLVRSLMKPSGVFILTLQVRDDNAYDGEIRSIREFETIFHVDLSKPRTWEAWNGDAWVSVTLPAFAGRPKSREGYIEEFTHAGFRIDKVFETGSRRQWLDFIVQ